MKRLIGGAGVAAVAVFGGVTSMGDDTTRNDAGEIVEGGGVGAFAIRVGDCLSVPDGIDQVESVEGVPCTQPHTAQAYAEIEMTGFDDYPGDPAITAQADEGCLGRFEAYVGAPYESSLLYISYLTPSAESWAEGDRVILCLVGPESGTIDYDARNSGA